MADRWRTDDWTAYIVVFGSFLVSTLVNLKEKSKLPNHNNIGFPSKTGPGSLNKITKLPSQPSMLGHHRHASEAPYIWRIAGGPMDDWTAYIVLFGCFLVSTLVNLKEKSKLAHTDGY